MYHFKEYNKSDYCSLYDKLQKLASQNFLMDLEHLFEFKSQDF